MSGRSPSHSDDGEATVRLSGRYVTRELVASIPEDDDTNLSAEGFGDGEASTSVLAAVEGAYTQVRTEEYGGEIELQTLQVATPTMADSASY